MARYFEDFKACQNSKVHEFQIEMASKSARAGPPIQVSIADPSQPDMPLVAVSPAFEDMTGPMAAKRASRLRCGLCTRDLPEHRCTSLPADGTVHSDGVLEAHGY